MGLFSRDEQDLHLNLVEGVFELEESAQFRLSLGYELIPEASHRVHLPLERVLGSGLELGDLLDAPL